MGEWQQKTIGNMVTLQRGIDLPDARAETHFSTNHGVVQNNRAPQ